MDRQGFWEVETPILTKSTPEGARDYLVPSRVFSRQLLRAAAVAPVVQADPDDFRFRKVFPDRPVLPRRRPASRPQPEFTQLDIEMSFPSRDALFTMIEGLMVKCSL